MIQVANPPPPSNGISKIFDLLWDAGDLGSRDQPSLNFEFNKTINVTVK